MVRGKKTEALQGLMLTLLTVSLIGAPAKGTLPLILTMTVMLFGFTGACAVLFRRNRTLLAVNKKAVDELHRKVMRTNQPLQTVACSARACLLEVEADLDLHKIKLTLHGTLCLTKVRRIVTAIDQRISDIYELLATENLVSAEQARKLADAPLVFDNSKTYAIEGTELPEIPLNEIELFVDALFRQMQLSGGNEKVFACSGSAYAGRSRARASLDL